MAAPSRWWCVAAVLAEACSALEVGPRGPAPAARRVASRRRLLAAAAGAAAACAPARRALARDLFYTKEDYCAKSDAELRTGIEFGCEAFASAEKRPGLRARALESAQRAAAQLDGFPGGAMAVRAELRKGPLASLRKQGRRLVALADGTAGADVGAAFDDTIAAIARVDAAARVLEYADSFEARATCSLELETARATLRNFVRVAGRS
ncbi:hypothetical protein M885DRAFT_626472 [Pelagophyceae sp. CCMP2097]|nr:hypothetical protein M885DRAFT_626472 [Pelagophyceae sp. CCMP2097]